MTPGRHRPERVGTLIQQALAEAASTDRSRGFTGVGPHRADLRLRVEGNPAHQVLSRGEGKLFVVGLVLAQARFLRDGHGRRPLVLVDDLASELDEHSRDLFFSELQRLRAQSFITTVSWNLVETMRGEGVRLFHVERCKPLKMV